MSGRTVGRKRFAQVCPACTVPALLPITSKPGEDFVDPAGDSLLPVLTFDWPMSLHRPKRTMPAILPITSKPGGDFSQISTI